MRKNEKIEQVCVFRIAETNVNVEEEREIYWKEREKMLSNSLRKDAIEIDAFIEFSFPALSS